MQALAAILAVVVVFVIIYLLWVAVAWGLLTVLGAFGITATISAWLLAVPLALASAIFRGSK